MSSEGGGASDVVLSMDSSVDTGTACLCVTVYASHWLMNHTGLDVDFGRTYVPVNILSVGPLQHAARSH